MPSLTEKHELFSNLKPDDAAAIIALIDHKTEDDMDKVLQKLDAKFAAQDAKFAKIDARFEAMDARMDTRMDSMEKTFDARLDAMDAKIDTKINTLYWLVGIVVAVASIATSVFITLFRIS